MRNMESELAVDSCIRGHHIFKNISTPTMGEQLSYNREISNNKDLYTAAVLRDCTTVGHVPRKISAACTLLLQREGSIHCVVTGECYYPCDLPQGLLEVPCMLKFKGQPKDVPKLKKLLTHTGTKTDGTKEEPVIQQPVFAPRSDN